MKLEALVIAFLAALIAALSLASWYYQ